MTEKLTDVWSSRDFPVLVEIARRVDAGETMPALQDVAVAIGMDEAQVQLAGAALKRRGMVDGITSMGGAISRFRHLSGEAYLITGLHPDGEAAVDRLISTLQQAADQTSDPDERSRLRTLARTAGDVSKDVLGAVLGALITTGVGAP